MQVHQQLNGGHYTGSSYSITMPIFPFMWCFNTQPLSKVIPHPITTVGLSSIPKTAKWGRLEVHTNYCPCLLLFFCIFPYSLTFTFNWFGSNIIFFHSCGNQSCCRSLYYQMFFIELEMRISHVEAVSSAFLSLWPSSSA